MAELLTDMPAVLPRFAAMFATGGFLMRLLAGSSMALQSTDMAAR